HSIVQNYVPADPQAGFGNLDSPTNGFSASSEHQFQLNQALQFPGKALLQGKAARRAAEIERLNYEATVRDVRLNAAAQFFQLALDMAKGDRIVKSVSDLWQMSNISVPTTGKTDSQKIASKTTKEQQTLRRLKMICIDDKTRLNTMLR